MQAAAILEAPVTPGNEAQTSSLPQLENGDRMTRPEFERRYDSMPNLKKAELIEGAVFMPSPVRTPQHGRPHAFILNWLGAYYAATPGTDLSDNGTIRLDLDNEPQPDALLRLEKGGSSRIDGDGYVVGAPELVVEIASSSVSLDLHAKKEMYRRHGAQEYLVWAVLDRKIFWFELYDGAYRLLEPDAQGIWRSKVFPGLWLAGTELLESRLAIVLKCVRDGTESPGHAEFVQKIAKAESN